MIVSKNASGTTKPSPHHKLVTGYKNSKIFAKIKKIRLGDFIGQKTGRVRKPETQDFFLGLPSCHSFFHDLENVNGTNCIHYKLQVCSYCQTLLLYVDTFLPQFW